MEPWINDTVFDYKGITITHFMIIRTTFIVVVTWASVVLSKQFWMRIEKKYEDFNRSNLFLFSRTTTALIVVIGTVVALEYLGIDFGKLTLIAGALSVGIGFGLQDVVRNIVSGIVVLTERAIRVGDWIVVGTTAGFVQKIAIRSTIIQTWDKSEIIVPNSDLVSQQITNWTLTRRTGRIVLGVGVAYGSDIEMVERILLTSATNHPSVLRDGSEPPPVVLFTRFGESALEFELRCFIGDVVNRLFVTSDLYKTIYKEFSHHGIKIPFPQRDIHVHSDQIPKPSEPEQS